MALYTSLLESETRSRFWCVLKTCRLEFPNNILLGLFYVDNIPVTLLLSTGVVTACSFFIAALSSIYFFSYRIGLILLVFMLRRLDTDSIEEWMLIFPLRCASTWLFLSRSSLASSIYSSSYGYCSDVMFPDLLIFVF